MKVLIIPEDPTHDAFIIKPVIEAILDDLGRSARVDVLRDPHLRGTSHALDPVTIAEIIDENQMIDLFLLVIDRDCDRERNDARAATLAKQHAGKLLTCVAKQEVEVWMIALHTEQLDATWTEIRSECDPKERFGDVVLRRLGNRSGPGGGRKAAMKSIAGNLRSLLSRCDELATLKVEIDRWWQSRA